MAASIGTAAFPPALLAQASDRLGAAVVRIERLQGGFTGQLICRLSLADGRRVVLKSSAPEPVASLPGRLWTDLFAREIWMYEHLTAAAPWRPVCYGSLAAAGWLGLLLEDLSDARRLPPWDDLAIDAVAAALAGLHRLPCPPDLPPDLIERVGPQRFWERLRQRGRVRGHLPAACSTTVWWHWFERALPLAERAYQQLERPDLRRGLNHNDVRSDNVLLHAGRAVFLDWGQVIWDTPARDSVYWALGVERESGRPAPLVHQRYLAHAPHPGEDAVRGVLAFWLGYFVDRLQAGGEYTANQQLRAAYLGPVIRWFALAFDLPLPAELAHA
ncbi:MAG: aminoglycoside phosphotransferase family protein [Chloroflexi bacterium]|nr:aminoglycoside phosphotransferase family protein [Chloroflexota bacterium]